MRLIGKGTDSTGTSGATLDLTAQVTAIDSASSTLSGKSEVTMSGKAAAFGGRMMGPVADQILKQFGENFAARVRESHQEPVQQPSQESGKSSAAESASAPSNEKPNELNGFALAWAVIRNWFRSLFGRDTA